MKTLFKYSIVIFLLIGINSCTEDFEEMNTDPFGLTEIDPEYLFTNAIRSTARDMVSVHHYRFSAQYAHSYVGIGIDRIPDEYKLVTSTDVYDMIYRNTYGGGLRYANETIRLTNLEGGVYKNEVRSALANIVAVINYAKLTDTFGDVPYTEGGWGQEGYLIPAYDTQEFIYHDMLSRLENSVSILQNANPEDAFPGADPLYDNDIVKWIRFANSLRLRFAMRIRHVDAATADPVIAECASVDLLVDNTYNATLPSYDKDDASLYSPWFGVFDFFRFKVSEKMIDWLKSTNDPRLFVYAEPNPDGEYVGMPNGLGDVAFANWDKNLTSDPGYTLVKRDADMYLMNSAETWFMKAEAALYGLISGDPNISYQQGIRISMEQWDIPEDSIINFLANEPQATLSGTTEEQFEQISTQMWVSLVPNFIESYANIRRTGYPVIPKRQAPTYSLGASDGELPSRLKYPLEEELNNPENYQKAVDNQGPDLITTRLWWDIRN